MSEKNITVINNGKRTVINAKSGEVLADVLARNGFTVPAACGRRGACGKCAVRLEYGRFENVTADENSMILSCKAVVCDDAVIGIGFGQGSGLTDFSSDANVKRNACGIAVDIGTTTVAATLLKADGTTVSESCLNPQSVYGADVVSRIKACSEGHLDELASMIRECVNRLASRLMKHGNADEMTVAGNTTMLHIFCGVSPESMGHMPFEPQFTDVVRLNGGDIGIDVEKITVLPSVSAFVGSDIVCGIFALGLHKTEERAFLADLGTNGELVFSDRGKLFCTSTAAGPALEGACIECGMGGVNGAVNRVVRKEKGIDFTTVGDAPPVGICGAGIVDAVALMLNEEIIDETGYLEENFGICRGVYISPRDVRQIQLAKSAVYSGIETLADVAGARLSDLDCFYIAGGLGYYIDPGNAAVIGLIPRLGENRVKPAGNTSLQGALMCIGSDENIEEMRSIAVNCSHIDLGGNHDFNRRFTENMFFDI